ncbi:MAG: DUF2085 domain-containing protein [Bacteroidota bacterium]
MVTNFKLLFLKSLYYYLINIPIPRGCHQIPERSLFYGDKQFPICARCSGVAFGHFLGILFAIIIGIFFGIINSYQSTNVFIFLLVLCIALSIPMGIDWTLQYLGIKESNNKRRLISGILSGLGFGFIYLFVLYFLFKAILLLFN